MATILSTRCHIYMHIDRFCECCIMRLYDVLCVHVTLLGRKVHALSVAISSSIFCLSRAAYSAVRGIASSSNRAVPVDRVYIYMHIHICMYIYGCVWTDVLSTIDTRNTQESKILVWFVPSTGLSYKSSTQRGVHSTL
jgi:hypothetical protein